MLALLGDVELNFTVMVPSAGHLARPNGVVYEGEPDTREERGFQCYVGNPDINCFDTFVITLRDDKYFPISGKYKFLKFSKMTMNSIITEIF